MLHFKREDQTAKIIKSAIKQLFKSVIEEITMRNSRFRQT